MTLSKELKEIKELAECISEKKNTLGKDSEVGACSALVARCDGELCVPT